ncbi:hypothetical protein BYT27DRAFT_7200113 [Phlegmacium glaucopus]|nr:hypothetical protein BYT27DRAFT_7200113 [Phlegmacium glaucopus]
MIGGPVVAGRTAYWELQVENHSNKKNSSLTLTLTRTLYLPGQQQLQQPTTAQISDTLTTVPFRGPEYIIPPGAEGVDNLVFDVPKLARGVQGGTESLFEIRKDIILQIPIDVVHPFIQQQPTPYTYANHGPIPELLPPMEPPLVLPQGYLHGYAILPGPQLLPPFQQFHPMQAPADGHTPPPPHSFFPEAVTGLPPIALLYLPPISYQTPIVESLPEPVFMHGIPPTITPLMDNFVTTVPNPSSPAPNAVLNSPCPQLTPKHSFTRDPALGSLTISKSERSGSIRRSTESRWCCYSQRLD